MLPLLIWAQKELKLENPHTTPFLMRDGMFLGKKGIMCGQNGAIAITYDEGQHWSTHLISPYITFKQVYMDDTVSIWLLTDTLLFHSKDGGLTFTQVYVVKPGYKFLKSRHKGNTCFILALMANQSTTSHLIRNSNQWTGASDDITIPFYATDFDFSDELHGIATNADDLFQTSNGGNTWQLVYHPGEYFHFQSIYWTGGNTFYALGYEWSSGQKHGEVGGKDKGSLNARIWKSTDGGSS